MSGKTILNVESPKTQSIEAVKSLLAYVGRASDPLPSDVSLENGRLVLVLSNKKDVYYTTTSRACSCPAHNFGHGNRCKHQRKFFQQVEAAKPASASDSIRSNVGRFKPFSELPSEERRAVAV